MTGYVGHFLSCTGGVWSVHPAATAGVSAVDGAVFVSKASAAPAPAPGPGANGAGAGVTRGGAS